MTTSKHYKGDRSGWMQNINLNDVKVVYLCYLIKKH